MLPTADEDAGGSPGSDAPGDAGGSPGRPTDVIPDWTTGVARAYTSIFPKPSPYDSVTAS